LEVKLGRDVTLPFEMDLSMDKQMQIYELVIIAAHHEDVIIMTMEGPLVPYEILLCSVVQRQIPGLLEPIVIEIQK